jgi:hypothetical protein
MNKHIIALLCAITVQVLAVGPKFPYILTWVPSPTPDVTGYYFYWRATNDVYADARRVAVPTNGFTGMDLRVLGLPKSVYAVAMTATNATAESELSDEFIWYYTNPARPSTVYIR